jgi:hypothetical protein
MTIHMRMSVNLTGTNTMMKLHASDFVAVQIKIFSGLNSGRFGLCSSAQIIEKYKNLKR